MHGRVSENDIALIRERTRIDEVVREYVALKSAGGGAFKGLCPFHDERSPSFHVTPARGMYYCFGCGEGGDAISFVRAMHPELSFVEAIQHLADKAGVSIHIEERALGEGGTSSSQRSKLLNANRLAAQFYEQQYASDEAAPGRFFLKERGFTDQDAQRFSVGYAPKGWDHLTRFLLGAGVTREDMIAAGLASEGQRGVYDKFRGRLTWAIRDITGDIIGFGARRLYDDDEGPKYLNTAETPLYKKSQVLYGINLAKRSIAREKTAVVVEGYTDVMACHLAGVETAVASCGTAFGEGHIRTIRRLIMDEEAHKAQVIFTFDGDAAGRKAALRAFENENKFVAQTYVAIEPKGLDPCELRQAGGDEAVRALIAAKIPLFEFAIKSTLSGHDLDSAEGRVSALRDAAPIVCAIKDPALRPEYTRRLAAWTGMDFAAVQREVEKGLRGSKQRNEPQALGQSTDALVETPLRPVEREALKCILQEPHLTAAWYGSVEPDCYTAASGMAIHAAIAKALPRLDDDMTATGWVNEVLHECDNDSERTLVRALATEPLATTEEEVALPYVTSVVGRLLEVSAERKIDALRSQLQRAASTGENTTALFQDLMALEQYRRDLRGEST